MNQRPILLSTFVHETYTIALRDMDSSGHLKVTVREGFLQRLRFTGLVDGIGARVAELAQQLQRNPGPLSKILLQRTLRLIEAVPGATVDATMLPGTKLGGLEIHFNTTAKSRQFGFLFHNYGQNTAGQEQLVASIQGNSAVAAGDRAIIQIGRSLNGSTKFGAIAYTLPLGANGLTADVSAALSHSHIKAYHLNGSAEALAASVSYPIVLNERDSLTAALAANFQKSETRIAGYLLFREKTATLRASLRWRRTNKRSITGATVIVSGSPPLIPVKVTTPIADNSFSKVEIQAFHDRMIGKAVALRIRVLGQYSSKSLS